MEVQPEGGGPKDTIPLTTIADILYVESDADFEQILAELPGDLRALRLLTKVAGHAGLKFPLQWRRDGGPSTVTTHCTDGVHGPVQLSMDLSDITTVFGGR